MGPESQTHAFRANHSCGIRQIGQKVLLKKTGMAPNAARSMFMLVEMHLPVLGQWITTMPISVLFNGFSRIGQKNSRFVALLGRERRDWRFFNHGAGWRCCPSRWPWCWSDPGWFHHSPFSCSAPNSVAAKLPRPSSSADSEISSHVAPRSIAFAVSLPSGRLDRS